MAGPFHGWLYLVDTSGNAQELINHARTAAYLSEIGLPNGMLVCDILDDGGSAAYPYAPCAGDDWEPLTFVTPAVDGAPWYSPDEPDSADALGFWIEEWTGLDNAHVHRQVASRTYGGSLGVLAANERTMSLNVLLFARTEAAMEYLYRWLEQTLSNVCHTCATDSVLMRVFTPDMVIPSNLPPVAEFTWDVV